jgi:TATA-binding protein-associated factor Taf7
MLLGLAVTLPSHHLAQAKQREIEELEQKIKAMTAKIRSMPNPMLKKKFQKQHESLEQQLAALQG